MQGGSKLAFITSVATWSFWSSMHVKHEVAIGMHISNGVTSSGWVIELGYPHDRNEERLTYTYIVTTSAQHSRHNH